MQARAIFEAAVEAGSASGEPVVPEIMVPLVMTKAELDLVKARIDAMGEAVAKETGVTVEYQVGTMIELPRAALRAGDIAESAEFFSFGTNDLTQTALGISRDDAGSFLGSYTQKGILDGSLRDDRPGRRRRIDPHGRGARTEGPTGHQARNLRRAWRRSGVDPFLQRHWSRLCILLALSRSHRASGSSAGSIGTEGGKSGLKGTGEMLHKGSCHCGKVAFEVETDLDQVVSCNCSHCRRKGYLSPLCRAAP